MRKTENVFITKSFQETQKLGMDLAEKIICGEIENRIICLEGDLGAGKTTFTQGFLKTLGAEGPYTSPTFLIMKQYQPHPAFSLERGWKDGKAYHIDAYRVNTEDVLNLGWEEIVSDPENIVIVEWADRIKKIIPKKALWLKFEWTGETKRKIIY